MHITYNLCENWVHLSYRQRRYNLNGQQTSRRGKRVPIILMVISQHNCACFFICNSSIFFERRHFTIQIWYILYYCDWYHRHRTTAVRKYWIRTAWERTRDHNWKSFCEMKKVILSAWKIMELSIFFTYNQEK